MLISQGNWTTGKLCNPGSQASELTFIYLWKVTAWTWLKFLSKFMLSTNSKLQGWSVNCLLANSELWQWLSEQEPGKHAYPGKGKEYIQFSSVQPFSHVRLLATPWTAARQASLPIANSWSLPKLMSIKSVMPTNHLILYHPLLLLPSIFSSIRVFSNESVLHIRWLKY